jgi:cation diffusion facilitator CzcD-associated flavoprotein CzcO
MKQPDFDVVIVGAGLSGIGAAVHLQKHCPGKTYCILEARGAIGGTWDLFRYPGIRSDSDMYTLGYNFKPWTEGKAIADGPNILNYIRETADEYQVTPKIRFHTRVVSSNWCSWDGLWEVTTESSAGERQTITCRFINSCAGYYRYDQGYLPTLPGYDDFGGRLIHPQHWPEDLDYTGKRVVVIGSGATAMTLVPAMAETAGHVTMLQRTPTYVVSRPAVDRIAIGLRKILPAGLAYMITRWKNVAIQQFYFRLARRRPEMFKRRLIEMVQAELGPDFDVEKHFTPSYKPWDQRLCLVPDSDLFKVLKAGTASVVTDQIETITKTGIRLKSGGHLDADIIITATGLNLLLVGGAELLIDGEKVDFHQQLNYKGAMLSNIPNATVTFGYTNASWTLKADLTSEYFCRLINFMDKHNYVCAVPELDQLPADTEPFLDFTAGYVQRALDQLPRQHSKKPWRLKQSYVDDLFNLRFKKLDDGVLKFYTAAELKKGASSTRSTIDQTAVTIEAR